MTRDGVNQPLTRNWKEKVKQWMESLDLKSGEAKTLDELLREAAWQIRNLTTALIMAKGGTEEEYRAELAKRDAALAKRDADMLQRLMLQFGELWQNRRKVEFETLFSAPPIPLDGQKEKNDDKDD